MKHLVLVTLIFFTLTQTASALDLQPLFSNGTIANEAQGIWESRGYGWVLEVTSAEIQLYHYTDAGCMKDEASTEELAFLAAYFAREDTRLWVTGREEGATLYPFNRLEAVPASCKLGVANTPRQVFDYFWSVMDRQYAFFDLYGVDWDERKAAFASRVMDDMGEKALFDLLSEMMEGLKDGHLELHADIEGEFERFRAVRTRVLGPATDEAFANQRRIKDRQEFVNRWFFGMLKDVKRKVLKRKYKEDAGGTVVWGRIGTAGYLAIYAMEEFDDDNEAFEFQIAAVHRIMNRVVTDLADTDRLVIDISMNQGGMDEISMAIASHFTNEPVLAFTKVALHSGMAPQEFYIQPAESGHYLKPITLLTSDVTVSAAEIFTMAMRALPNVTHVGDTTAGALSDILLKPLPNGWRLLLSNEIYRDATGTLWEGKGIPPTTYIQIFDSKDLGGRVLQAIEEATER